MDPKQFSNVIADIYDTSIKQDNWQAALDGFVDFVGAKGATLFAQDLTGNPFQIQHHSSIYNGTDPAYYLEHIAPYEEEAWQATAMAPVQSPVMDDDVWPDLEAVKNRTDYVWHRKEFGIFHRGGVRLNDAHAWFDGVGFQFDESLTSIPTAAFDNAAVLLPHMAKAVEIGRSFFLLHQHYHAIMNALNHIRIGVCIVSSSGCVDILNREAERILELKDGVSLSAMNGLVCRDPELSGQIKKAIETISTTAAGANGPQNFRFNIPRRSLNHPFLMEISPIADTSGEISYSYHGAQITLIDPEKPHKYDIDRIATALSLSKAESEVCQGVVDGLTTPNIAERRNVSPETARCQVKSIFRKSSTSSRADLIRLALSIDPPIDPPNQKTDS